MAVLEKRAGMSLSQYDAFVNITGGVRMSEPAVDLGILMAIVSGHRDLPVGDDVVVFGEVGLSGEIRSVPMAKQRVKEAEKLGFRTVILPKACMRSVQKRSAADKKEPSGIRLVPVSTVAEAIRFLK